MERNHNRYKELERNLTYAIVTDAVIFVLYLIFAGAGIVWLKVITSILAILLSGLCLYTLYISKELLRQRSLWITAAATAIILCTIVSLLLNYPGK